MVSEKILGPDISAKAHEEAKDGEGLRSELDSEEAFGIKCLECFLQAV